MCIIRNEYFQGFPNVYLLFAFIENETDCTKEFSETDIIKAQVFD